MVHQDEECIVIEEYRWQKKGGILRERRIRDATEEAQFITKFYKKDKTVKSETCCQQLIKTSIAFKEKRLAYDKELRLKKFHVSKYSVNQSKPKSNQTIIYDCI